jgi:hypothetical protein
MRRHAQKALTLAALAALAGCTSSTQQAAVTIPGGCPQVLVVGETSNVTKFQTGAGRDPTDVVLQARIADFQGSCALNARSRRLDVDLKLQVEAIQGPANRDRRGVYDYFVAIADPTDAILAKKVFPAEVAFATGTARLDMVEELTQTIPLRANEVGADYRIYVGFQLSDAELAYNRARLQRR